MQEWFSMQFLPSLRQFGKKAAYQREEEDSRCNEVPTGFSGQGQLLKLGGEQCATIAKEFQDPQKGCHFCNNF